MGTFAVKARIEKSREQDGVAYMWGWAALSRDDIGEPVVDSDGDFIPVQELEKAAQQAFLQRCGEGAIGVMHESYKRADLVESFVLSTEKRAAFGLGLGPEGWMVGLRSSDPEVVKAARSGYPLELSIRGSGRREIVRVPHGVAASEVLKRGQPSNASTEENRDVNVIRDLSLADVELLSIVDKGASGNDRVRPKIVLVKGRKPMPKTPVSKARSAQMILAELFEAGKLADVPPEDKEVLLMAAANPMAPMPKPEPETPATPEPPQPPQPPETPAATGGGNMDEEKNEDMEKLAKRNVELEQRVVELEKAAQHATIVELVKRDMAYLPGQSVDEIAKVIAATRRELGEEDADRVETMLKASSEALKKSGLFEAVGVRHDSQGGSNSDVKGQLAELAKSLREKNPKLSASEALLVAGKQRPDLWGASKRKGE